MKKLIFLLLLTAQVTGSCSHPATGCHKDVMKAYSLRMEGRSDQALALLDSLLKTDSTNAMAYYERARVLDYMMKSGGEPSISRILSSSVKAASCDSTNVIYAYDLAVNYFLDAYLAMHQGKEDVAPLVERACNQFKHVLQLKPGTPEAMLQLVEIYGLLPAAMGGDSLQALMYAGLLEQTDEFYAARATQVLGSPEGVTFWNGFLAAHDTSTAVLKEIGIASLYQENPTQAEKYFRLVMKMDSTQNVLLLDLARYYMLLVMQDRSLADSLLPVSAGYITEYLSAEPLPAIPLQAYATGMLVKTNMFTGHKEEAEKLMEKAKALDPWFSRAFAIPGPEIFLPPDKTSIYFSSFFRPF